VREGRPRQLPLPLGPAGERGFASYVPGPNAEAVALLRALARGEEPAASVHPNVHLWGPPGVGKTHLLHALCAEGARSGGLPCAYLPLDQRGLTPDALEGLERLGLVCLDALDAVAGEPLWEEALFHLCNRLREAGVPLVSAARAAPAGLGLALPDLRSRLAWGQVLRLRPLRDGDLERLLREAARRRGLHLGEEAARFLLRRCPREPGRLLALLERLDRVALAEGRRLTVPFLSRALEGGLEEGRGA